MFVYKVIYTWKSLKSPETFRMTLVSHLNRRIFKGGCENLCKYTVVHMTILYKQINNLRIDTSNSCICALDVRESIMDRDSFISLWKSLDSWARLETRATAITTLHYGERARGVGERKGVGLLLADGRVERCFERATRRHKTNKRVSLYHRRYQKLFITKN